MNICYLKKYNDRKQKMKNTKLAENEIQELTKHTFIKHIH